jgi:glycosyltransferase involved in cell wall biosynthesis
MEKYVCAFRGRRDAYQVPLALAEAGELDQFITDAYAVDWLRALAKVAPATWRAKLDFRSEPGIPMDRVRCLWGTTALEQLRHRLGYAPMMTYNKLDPEFALAAAKRAAQTRSHLFLYSPYAWEAFTATYAHTPRKVLFQYHPHPALERQVMEQDAALFPGFGESFSGTLHGQVPPELARRDHDAWRHADLIFCASAFTKRSLLEVGADEKKCRVVPYGIDVPAVAAGQPPPDKFHAVFVGSGGQRKGLHHLLLAWKRASLPESSRLTLVCRVLDREIERLAIETQGVEIVRGVSQSALAGVYASSTLFVMPSLIEGFGQVYLEALAQGSPVLGTANTCLPDLGGESDGIFLTRCSDVEGLTGKLEELSKRLPGDRRIRTAAAACAAKFTWPAFRDGLRRALNAT